MTLAKYDSSLAYDQIMQRGLPGRVVEVTDPDTGIPVEGLLDMDGQSIARLVSNSQGYVQPFMVEDGPPLVRVRIETVAYHLLDLSLLGEASLAAQQAAQAAIDAANLVGAPADTAIATAVNAAGSATRAALDDRYAGKATATSAAAGLMAATDKAKLDAATPSANANTLVSRGTNGAFAVVTPTAGSHPTNKTYVDGLDAVPKLGYKGKKAEDAASTYPTGYSTGLFAASDGWPHPSFSQVVTFSPPGYTGGTVQWAYPYTDSSLPPKWRSATNATGNPWGPWQEVASAEGTVAAIAARQVGNALYSVKDYGATGNGTTDDTAAIQAACNAAATAGGGAVVFPPGIYYVAGVVELGHNVALQNNGAQLVKKQSAGETSYAFFCTRSHGQKGYGTGGSRIRALNMNFKGNFANGRYVCAFALHHTRDFIATGCTFEEMHGTGHIFDLAGCDGITIRDSYFIGASTDNSRAEAIQIDISANGALSVTDDLGSHSGLPTINVTVDNCKFLPLKIGSTTYPAPVPIGSHAQWEGKWFRNIKFINNIVDGPRMHAGSSDPQGVVHFSCVDGLVIVNNKFTAPATPPAGRVIGIWKATTGKASNADPNGSPADVTFSSPMYPRNIKVRGNEFEGFTQTGSNSKVIYIDGFNGLDVSGNEWRGCASMYDLRDGTNLTGGGNKYTEVAASVATQIVNLNKVVVLSVQGEVIDARGAGNINEIVAISNSSGPGRFNNSLVAGKGSSGIVQAAGSTVDLGGNTQI